MELDISRQIFEKYSKHLFHENPSFEAELFHADGRMDEQADRYDEANTVFSQFCERA
jgi:hypothetical protein